jgi:flagellar protein FlgJ
MSDLISNLSSLYTNGTYTNSTTSSLENTLNNTNLSAADDDELMSVCKEFEEYFVEQMVKSMVKMANIDGEDEDGYSSLFGLSSDSSDSGMSTLTSYYGDMMVTQLSTALCESESNSLGLAQTLYNQLKRNYSIDSATDA